MTSRRFLAIGSAILLGLAWFMVLMPASIGIVLLNARISPAFAWFPVPVLALTVGTAIWAERRWQIGLSHPAGVPWARVYLLAFTTTVLGVCVAILQGAWFGMSRGVELGPPSTSVQFQLAYAFVLPMVAAILAEVAFRGIMQGRLHALLAPLPAILVVAAINTASHRWAPELVAQWFGYFVLLAGCGYVRWLGGSIIPPLMAHFWQNVALAFVTWRWGPFDLGALSAATLTTVAIVGGAALAVTLAVARGTRPYPGLQHGSLATDAN